MCVAIPCLQRAPRTEIIRNGGVPLGIGGHTNTRKGMVHFGEVAKYRCGAIVFAHGLIKVTAGHKDGGDSLSVSWDTMSLSAACSGPDVQLVRRQ